MFTATPLKSWGKQRCFQRCERPESHVGAWTGPPSTRRSPRTGPTVKVGNWRVRRRQGELLFNLEVGEAFLRGTQHLEAIKCNGLLFSRVVKSPQMNPRYIANCEKISTTLLTMKDNAVKPAQGSERRRQSRCPARGPRHPRTPSDGELLSADTGEDPLYF